LQSRQGRLHLPVADPKLGGDPGDAGAGVAAGLQVGPKVLEAEHTGALLQEPSTAVVDHKPAFKDQLTVHFRSLWVCPCVAGPAWDDDGKIHADQRVCAAIVRLG